ncbi:prokaryotic polysaccharide deacetylase [Haloferax tailed virus 1]|uniref:Prokaryotic polysaccharide deacetylase n=1 Tax=Haloferax tailed virus 1 TaxID=2507575 RepID=A0A410N6W3_HFTV1|nr:prokaryotic polysaccharide deacetylase [Haloferax tailed virus 1]QAS68864.1 prokaryotic polysaccharide deacetylase [Haloferax tailed virus 1]
MTGLNPDGLGRTAAFSNTSAESVSAVDATIDRLYAQDRIEIPTDSRQLFSTRGTVLRNFEDLSGWTANIGSLSAETSDVYVGSQSARLTASSSAVDIRYSFGTAQDFTGKGFSMALKRIDVSGSSDSTPIKIRLVDGNTNYRTFSARCRPGGGDEWGRRDFGFESEDTGFDVTNVQTMTVTTNSRSSIDILVDDIRVVDSSGTGQVIVTIDDVHTGDKTAAEVFGRYGIPIGLAANAKFLDQSSSKLTTQEFKDLLAKPHVYAVNHGYNHYDYGSYSIDEIEDDVIRGKYELQDLGVREPNINHYVYPSGNYAQESIDMLSNYHVMSWGTGAESFDALTPNQLTSPWHNLRCSFDSGTAEAEQAVNDAATYNQTAHIYFHSDNVTQSEMESVAQTINSADVTPITLMDFYNQQ